MWCLAGVDISPSMSLEYGIVTECQQSVAMATSSFLTPSWNNKFREELVVKLTVCGASERAAERPSERPSERASDLTRRRHGLRVMLLEDKACQVQSPSAPLEKVIAEKCQQAAAMSTDFLLRLRTTAWNGITMSSWLFGERGMTRGYMLYCYRMSPAWDSPVDLPCCNYVTR